MLSDLNLVSVSTGGATRTPDTRFWRPMLYQLNYTRVSFILTLQKYLLLC